MSKYLTAAIDLEVTSFNPIKGALTQLSCILLRDDVEIDRIDLYINPYTYNKITEVFEFNLNRSNRTEKEVRTYPDQAKQFSKFLDFLQANMKEDEKLQLLGHNVTKHDSQFIEEWFEENNEDMYSLFDYAHLDTLHLARHMRHWGLLQSCPDDKLGTLCEYFDVELESWHNSMEDIQATLEVYEKMKKYIISEL